MLALPDTSFSPKPYSFLGQYGCGRVNRTPVYLGYEPKLVPLQSPRNNMAPRDGFEPSSISVNSGMRSPRLLSWNEKIGPDTQTRTETRCLEGTSTTLILCPHKIVVVKLPCRSNSVAICTNYFTLFKLFHNCFERCVTNSF